MKRLILIALVFLYVQVIAQDTYQKPPKEILDLVDVQLAPSVIMDDAGNYAILRYQDAYKTIAELSEEEMRLAGLRINPNTDIGSRTNYINNVKVLNIKAKKASPVQVTGMPANPRLAYFSWSPDQSKIAMTNTTEDGVEVWMLDVPGAKMTRLTEARVNANLRDVINWFADGSAMLVKMAPADREEIVDKNKVVPVGPTISTADGKKAQNRTYQDLLKSKIDEANFEVLARSEIHKINLDGTSSPWLPADMYSNISFSPDGTYVMVTLIQRPFSYLVPYYRFPSTTTIHTADGKAIATVSQVPLIEDLPQGFGAVATGRRSLAWRSDKPATLTYVEALDGGDPAQDVEYRDEMFELEAPFSSDGKSIMKFQNRYAGIIWGDDNNAVAYDRWWANRNMKTYHFSPSKGQASAKVITDRNYQDVYSNPGSFATAQNEYGKEVLAMSKGNAFLMGPGYSEKGQFPFVDRMSLASYEKTRVYESKYTDKMERLYDYDVKNNTALLSLESKNEYPNFYFRSLGNNKLRQLTNFENPFQAIQDVHKEVITYKRDDGLELSGTLYLPVGYDKEKKEKMPMILWAYPREYKDKSSASQSTQNPNQFTYPSYRSPVYWVARGYVVLANAAFPIIGEGDKEPNDTFRSQLVANGRAAIDAVDKLGYIDRNRVGVGGHSYGAFMVANLLSHSDDYAAGIARSGAYNRTLTPFGFQSEQRSYWDAPEVYYTMSPFMHADKMKTPLLLIHGEADNNSGTYPMQSERYFNALKGLGATVRLVMLPKESHGYRAKESVLHVLYEQDSWLETYVKNRPSTNPDETTLSPKK